MLTVASERIPKIVKDNNETRTLRCYYYYYYSYYSIVLRRDDNKLRMRWNILKERFVESF